MAQTKAKHHHLIPQTYLKAWANSRGTVKIQSLDNPNTTAERNIRSIACITDFYTIKAGMPICTQKDADTIFSPLESCQVELDGKTLSDSLALNSKYYDFDRWRITHADGSPASKKKIKSQIEQNKIKDIEENWSIKYENKWNSEVEAITSAVHVTSTLEIPEFDREFLTKFYTALDWRGFCSSQEFESVLQSITDKLPANIIIPEDDRALPHLNTPHEEMRHCLLLRYYRDFLNDSGVIYSDAMASLHKTSFHFLVASGSTKFITSDSPAFTHKSEGGDILGLLPITPNILMAKGRCQTDNGKYYITHLTDKEVRIYNEIIYSNATEFVVLEHE